MLSLALLALVVLQAASLVAVASRRHLLAAALLVAVASRRHHQVPRSVFVLGVVDVVLTDSAASWFPALP
jgi:hypothetical protein